MDAQLLLLLLVGEFDRTLIKRFKRTAGFEETDYDLMVEYVKHFRRILITPHILTEIDNFAEGLKSQMEPFRRWLASDVLPRLRERSVQMRQAAQEKCFPTLGLTDSASVSAVRRSGLVLTKDFDLWRHLSEQGLPVINFDHLRAEKYGWN